MIGVRKIMSKNYKYIGKSIPRHDVREKVTGKIKYVGDIKVEGMLYARLKTSDIAHGIIKKIDTSKAEALPGVVGIYHYKNSPSTLYNSNKWMAGQEELYDQRLFCDKVRFYGDIIAAVVAKDIQTAIKAEKLIEIDYEELPVVIDSEVAINKDSIKIHERENLLFEKNIEIGNVDKAFEQAEYIVEDKIYTPKQHHAAMEPHVCLAIPEANKSITIITACQVVFQVQLIVAEVLGLPINKVRVIKATMGGSFGGKGQPTIEPICGFLAKATGKPVRLVTDRKQSILSTRTRHATVGKVTTAVDAQGNIIARELDIIADTGAYCTNAKAIIMSMAKKFFRLYRIKNARYFGRSTYTNTPIAGACRGYGSPQIHTITEINIDNVARKIGMNPVDLRLKNLIHPYDNDPTGGPNLGNARVIDCVKKGAETFDWYNRYNQDKGTGRYRRGVGMACSTHGNGYYGAYPDFITMTLRINSEGEVILNGSLHDMGCGTVTTMQQIVAEVLDIDPKKILVHEGDTHLSPYDSAGTQASRVTYVCGGCAKKVAEIVKEKFTELSAEVLNCNKESIILSNETVYNKQDINNAVSYGDMVKKIFKEKHEDVVATYTYKSPGNPGVYSANFVEVEVDIYTGMVTVKDFLAVHDIGRAINRDFVEGQIHGGVQLGLGFALMEEIEVDKNGRIKTENFNKYHIINAPDMPEVKILLIEEDEKTGPFGAKSVGEISAVAAAPAVINAINNALDINITHLPATPERIIKALQEKERNQVQLF